MLTRRDLLQVASAAATFGGLQRITRLAAQEKLDERDLLRFEPLGQVTLLHLTDLHAQLVPLHYREPTTNIGVGESRGVPPHLTGEDFLAHYAIRPDSAEAYALTDRNFAALARNFGPVGGLDRIATLVNAIRAERPGRTLLLDGGDTWQGSYTALQTRGADMVRAMNLLGTEAMTGHWDFTYGEARVRELIAATDCPFLAANVRESTWGDEVFPGEATFVRGGLKIAVIGQAYPYTPIANPRHLIPEWEFGIREDALAERVARLRDDGADLVVLLSHNGSDIDRKLAGRVPGIDVILGGHTHDALPQPTVVGKTLVVASGCHGKFLSRLDLDVDDQRIVAWRYRLIPVLADAIRPDPEMARLVSELRAPYRAELERVVGQTESLLYRRGNFAGTFDDLICQALLAERDAEIALSPGFRWGATLLPGAPIRVEDVYAQTAITYPAVYRNELSGAELKAILEDVADNLFNPDPYYCQGGDMVRAGGLAFTIDVSARIGARISDLTLLRTGARIEDGKKYVVAGWASVNEGVQGPPVWDLVMRHIESQRVVRIPENRSVRVINP